MSFPRLPTSTLDKTAGLLRPACVLPERVGMDNPALDVMTDFRRLTAFIATPGDTIKQAEERMIRRKVRLLFVMDSQDRVAGLITSSDIHGEKPLQVVQSRAGSGRFRRSVACPRRPCAGDAQGTRPAACPGDRKCERPANGARPAVAVAAVQAARRQPRNHRGGAHLH